MIGLARETVARTLSDLEEEGLIRREGRRGMWLCFLDERTVSALPNGSLQAPGHRMDRRP